MYIHDLSLSKFRCFGSAELDFLHPDRDPSDWLTAAGMPPFPSIRNVNLLLGDNGAGKTSVLRAIALSLLAPTLNNSGFVPHYLVRRTGRMFANSTHKRQLTSTILCKALLHQQDDDYRTNFNYPRRNIAIPYNYHGRAILKRIEDREFLEARDLDFQEQVFLPGMFSDKTSGFLVLGYGATRRTEADESFDSSARYKSRPVRYQRIAGLFEDHITLTPLNVWLPECEEHDKIRFKEIVSLLNRVLPRGVRLVSPTAKVFTKSGQKTAQPLASLPGQEHYTFRYGRSQVPFNALSDGYRAFIGWVGDMLYHLWSICPPHLKLTDLRGVVMVDEVDLHLHPEWQRIVVDSLRKTFPRLQFVFTSHSPLVAGSLEAGNIWVMEQMKSGAVIPRRYQERIHGLSADQILTGSYFGLTTPRAPDAEDELQALSRKAATGDPNAGLQFLKNLTRGTYIVSEAERKTL